MSEQWNGRDVDFVEFDIAVGELIMAAATASDRSTALYLTLVHSARYADDGTPVFASVDEVRAQPFRLIQRIQRLAAAASTKNRVEGDDDDAPLDAARADVPASARAGNGEARQ